MIIESVLGCPYEDHEGEVSILRVHLDKGERLCLHDNISIEMMDDTFIQREIKIINPKYAQDFSAVSSMFDEEIKSGKTRWKPRFCQFVEGECTCDIVVMNVPSHEVKSEEELLHRKLIEEYIQKINLTPYKELKQGQDSIFNNIREGYTIPDKVLLYLQSGEAYRMSPGIYSHPFNNEVSLLGPYLYTDGKYIWDRDTWKYVIKYGLTLSNEFVDYVMSDEGTEYLQKHHVDWGDVINNKLAAKPNFICLLPEDSGDVPLEKF